MIRDRCLRIGRGKMLPARRGLNLGEGRSNRSSSEDDADEDDSPGLKDVRRSQCRDWKDFGGGRGG